MFDSKEPLEEYFSKGHNAEELRQEIQCTADRGVKKLVLDFSQVADRPLVKSDLPSVSSALTQVNALRNEAFPSQSPANIKSICIEKGKAVIRFK